MTGHIKLYDPLLLFLAPLLVTTLLHCAPHCLSSGSFGQEMGKQGKESCLRARRQRQENSNLSAQLNKNKKLGLFCKLELKNITSEIQLFKLCFLSYPEVCTFVTFPPNFKPIFHVHFHPISSV